MTRGTMTPAGGQKPRHAASLIALRLIARLTASRRRRSAHGDFGSHWSANSSQLIEAWREATIWARGSRLTVSASGPSSAYEMSASPVLSIAARVRPSLTLRVTSRLRHGASLQLHGCVYSTNSTPGV